MGKKFGDGNQKAIEARAKKAAAKDEVEKQKEKKRQDEAWRDDSKDLAAKEKRKQEKEDKAKRQLENKAAKKAMEEEENQELQAAYGAKATKVTRAQIEAQRNAYKKPTKILAPGLEFLAENPNKKKAESLASGHVDASSLDEALDQLSTGSGEVDRNPEKRMKAAFEAFCERETPLMKKDNPFLRRSQLKEQLWKKWQKSPENPLNQAAAAKQQ